MTRSLAALATVASVAALLATTAACGRRDAPAAAPPLDARSTAVPDARPLPDPLPDVAARVNGELVPMRNVKLLGDVLLQDGTFSKEQRPQAYRQALDRFVERELLLQEAIARGLSADQHKVEQAEDKLHAAYPDDSAWRQFLAQQGFDPLTFKTELRAQYTVSALLQRTMVSPHEITDDQIAEYYHAHVADFTVAERYKVRHILIRLPADVTPARKGEFKTRAENLLVQARTGADFAALAKAHSEDEKSAPDGGLISAFGKGELDPALAAIEGAVAPLKPGQISDVVETKVGFHVLKLEARLAGGPRSMQDAAEPIRQILVKERRAALRAALVRSLRAKAKIETYL